jgi:hypothetical protein
MIHDAWLAARAQIAEFVDLHGDLVFAGGILLIVGWFVYRWLDAR